MRLILLPLLGLSAFARGGSGRTKAKHCPRKKSATEEYGSGYSLFKEIKCNADGTYEPIQQYADDVRDEGAPEEYVCVSPHSGMVRFELGRNKNSKPCRHEDFNEETLFPNQKSKDDKPCDYAKYRVMVRYEEAEKAGRMISDLSAMQCLDNGLFRPLQYSHMGAYCVASADGAYLGAPSKDDKNEDYCPVGQDKDDNKEDDVYDEGDDYDEDDGEGDDQDDALSENDSNHEPETNRDQENNEPETNQEQGNIQEQENNEPENRFEEQKNDEEDKTYDKPDYNENDQSCINLMIDVNYKHNSKAFEDSMFLVNDVIDAFNFSGGNTLSLIGQKYCFGFQASNYLNAKCDLRKMRINMIRYFRLKNNKCETVILQPDVDSDTITGEWFMRNSKANHQINLILKNMDISSKAVYYGYKRFFYNYKHSFNTSERNMITLTSVYNECMTAYKNYKYANQMHFYNRWQ